MLALDFTIEDKIFKDLINLKKRHEINYFCAAHMIEFSNACTLKEVFSSLPYSIMQHKIISKKPQSK